MFFKTPIAKVYGYRAIIGIQYGAAALFGVLGFPRFINPFLAGIGAALLLVTAFASSKTDLAKEVKKIVQFHDDGHPWKKFPTTDEERDALRRELYPQLVLAGKKMIRRFKEFNKLSLADDDLLGLKAARVDYQNAKNAFYARWRAYEGADILPFQSGREPWSNPEEFLVELQKRMKLQKLKKSLLCA
jgi:hypothetical protein